MQIPKPSSAHNQLARLAGRWIGNERLSPSPWNPKGGTAVGKCENSIVADGFALAQNYEQARSGDVNFRAHGVFSYDATEKACVLHWWDSTGMGVSVFKGTFEGDTLCLTCRLPQGFSRGTWLLLDSGHYRFRMEVSGDGREWNTMIEGDYTREN
jgi:hypothetical protein